MIWLQVLGSATIICGAFELIGELFPSRGQTPERTAVTSSLQTIFGVITITSGLVLFLNAWRFA